MPENRVETSDITSQNEIQKSTIDQKSDGHTLLGLTNSYGMGGGTEENGLRFVGMWA